MKQGELKQVEQSYRAARDIYARLGVDSDRCLAALARVKVSLNCWQGDDVTGFENTRGSMGGVMPTGSYPGCARNPDELRSDLEKALSLIPGRHRVNLHSIYAETGNRQVPRNELELRHFSRWTDWAAARGLGLDFNGTFFSHPKADSGFTLSHPDAGIRRFWIEHGAACRRIGAGMGRRLGSPCVTNLWVPDGSKDIPADRKAPRERLAESLDAVFAEKFSPARLLDAVEGKLFGIGSESYVVGSYDFYLAYAVSRRKILCLDMGHFHPTESVADKLSALLCALDAVLLHVSRGVRWDSDHVAILNDDLRALAEEIVRGGYLRRVHIGLDFFDASINRIAAWVIGARAVLKALLIAMLEPAGILRAAERKGDYAARLAWIEEAKSLPAGSVWDYHCLRSNVPCRGDWLAEIAAYERAVLSRRA